MRSHLRTPWRSVAAWLYHWVRLPETSVRSLRELESRGTIVYVARTRGFLTSLLLNTIAIRSGVPLAGHVVGWNSRLASLLGQSPRGTPRQIAEFPLTEAVRGGQGALVFLWKRVRTLKGKREDFGRAELQRLLTLQAECERPIFLIPVAVLLGRDPGMQERRAPLLDTMMGPREAPGPIRSLLSYLRFRRTLRVQLGEAIDLSALRSAPDAPPIPRLARMVRGALVHHLARAERSVMGPLRKSPKRLRHEILRDHELRASLQRIGSETGRSQAALLKRSDKLLNSIAARYSPAMVAAVATFFRVVFNRIYDGIWVDEEGLQRMTDAGRHGPIVLCPSHRSHIDYLVMSWAMHMRGLTAPHIAAGKNLSFFPIGSILRHCGAFFLRRSFRGDPTYAAVFRAYIRRLLHDGHMIEFFIEGTRSRSGKPLQPRLGIIGYQIEAFLESGRSCLSFVPIAIGYTRVIEASSYGRELKGGEKNAENVSGLLGARKIFRKRWGRIYIQVGRPVDLGPTLEAYLRRHQLERGALVGEARRTFVREFSLQLSAAIASLTTVTPTALCAAALLGVRRRGMDLQEIRRSATRLVDFIARQPDARVSDALRYDDEGLLESAAVREAIGTLEDEGHLRQHQLGARTLVEITREGRTGLDYYKNSLIPFLAPLSLAATALLDADPLPAKGTQKQTALADPVAGAATALAEVLKREFIFAPSLGAKGALEAAFEALIDDGLATRDASADGAPRLRPTEHGHAALLILRSLCQSLVEGYWITTRTTLRLLAKTSRSRTDLREAIMEEGRARTLIGEIDAPEALCRPVIDGALSYLQESGGLGHITVDKEEHLTVASVESLKALIETLEPHVGIRDLSAPPSQRFPALESGSE